MNIDEIKQKLHSYKYILFKIDAVNENLSNLASMIDTQRNVKSPVLTGMPSGNKVSDPVVEAAGRIVDKFCKENAKLENELDELFKEKHAIDLMIRSLDSTEKEII